MTINIVENGQWSGGGHNVLANIAFARKIHPKKFSTFGTQVFLRNVVPMSALKAGGYVYLPQNAWAWHGPTCSYGEFRLRTLLKIASTLAARRAASAIRIGPMIPEFQNAADSIVANVLDQGFDHEVNRAKLTKRPDWLPSKPYMLLPGSIWSYRNVDAVLDAYSLYQSNGGSIELVVVGTIAPSSGAKHIFKRCGGMSNVTFVDRKINRCEILFAMMQCELCILSSLVEASPVTMLEAAAIGCPVLAWDNPAYRFLQQSENLQNIRFCNAMSVMASEMSTLREHSECDLSEETFREQRRYQWANQFIESCER